MYEVREGVGPGVGLEWWLSWFAHPFPGHVQRVCPVLCFGSQLPAFAPALQKWPLGFLVFLHLVLHNLPQLSTQLFLVLYNVFVFRCSRHLFKGKHWSEPSQVPGLILSQNNLLTYSIDKLHHGHWDTVLCARCTVLRKTQQVLAFMEFTFQ